MAHAHSVQDRQRERVYSLARAVVLAVATFLVFGRNSTASAQTSPCVGAGVWQLQLQAVMPPDFRPIAGQIGADCLAWQEFVYLNWAADPANPGHPDPNAPASAFGAPGSNSPTVWESYLEASAIFNPTTVPTLWRTGRPVVKPLARLSKFADSQDQMTVIAQATGGWLTDQRGNLTFYEVRLNQDEFEYITKNTFDLTTFAGQASCAAEPGTAGKGGFNLPSGGGASGNNQDVDCTGKPATYGQNMGAVEVKAAWVILPSDGSLNYRYKTASAQLTPPGGTTTNAIVGLVGLHIIHKYPGAPQFVWATFEHIDNAPDDNAGHPSGPVLPANPNQQPRPAYTFYNPSCTPSQDPVYACATNKSPPLPALDPCPQGTPPTAQCSAYWAPMQITRLVPVGNQANSVTGYLWGLLPANSVFNYYRLVNVQWPQNPTSIVPQSRTPLSGGTIQPPTSSGGVANTTLESYVQTTLSCMDCHQSAPIAQPAQQRVDVVQGRPVRNVLLPLPKAMTTTTPYASDYSFVFSTETRR